MNYSKGHSFFLFFLQKVNDFCVLIETIQTETLISWNGKMNFGWQELQVY